MKDNEFLIKLIKELLNTGVALATFNADSDEFSIVPKSEFFILPSRKEKESTPKWKDDSFPYVGKTIVLTGNMEKLVTRSWLKRHLRQRGAIVRNAVTSETDLLVVGAMYDASQKMIKANEYGIKKENYAVFLHSIGYEDRRQSAPEPAYVSHARPSQRAATGKPVGLPTYTGEKRPEDSLTPFSNEDRMRMQDKGRDLEKIMANIGTLMLKSDMKWIQQLGRGERPTSSEIKSKDKIEYIPEFYSNGTAGIKKFVNGYYKDAYVISKALLDGCKDLDGKGHNGAANWSYGDSYARIALENKFGKQLVELCREHIVSKL